MPDQRTIQLYNSRAADYAQMVAHGPRDKNLDAFIAAMPSQARVLDLGCGHGRASAVMRDAGLIPDPVDAAEGMVTLANETYDIDARHGTFDDLDAVATYDGVWANFSLLHAPRPDLPRHFAAIFRALKSGGVFHVGMKTGTGAVRDGLSRLYTFVTVPELHQMLEDAGLLVTYTTEGVDKGLAGTQDPWVICRATKE